MLRRNSSARFSLCEDGGETSSPCLRGRPRTPSRSQPPAPKYSFNTLLTAIVSLWAVGLALATGAGLAAHRSTLAAVAELRADQQAAAAKMEASLRGINFGALRVELSELRDAQAESASQVLTAVAAVARQSEALGRRVGELRSHVEDEIDEMRSDVVDVMEDERVACVHAREATRHVERAEAGGEAAAAVARLEARVEAMLTAPRHAAAPRQPPPAPPSPRRAKTVTPPLPPPPPPLARRSPPPTAPAPLVEVVFEFEKGLGPMASLYWLRDDGTEHATEHLYAEIPAGMSVSETTRPGDCWRARDPHSGNRLLSYCATRQPRQRVAIGPSDEVEISFHFLGGALTGRHVDIMRGATFDGLAHGRTREHRLGSVAAGGHLSVEARRGELLRAVEAGTGRVLLSYMASAEASQMVNIGEGGAVELELVSPRRASAAVHVFRRWGADGDEHFHAAVAAGAVARWASDAGEEWVVRSADGEDRLLLIFNAAAQPGTPAGQVARQRINLPVGVR